MTPNTLVFRLLLALVVLAPLPLGANRPLAWTALAVGVGVLLCVWTALIAARRAHAPVPLARMAPAVILFGAAMLWAVVQALPGTPEAWHSPVWREAAAALATGSGTGPAVAGRIALDPGGVGRALMQMLAYAGIFYLAVQLGRDRSRAREGLVVVALAGVVYASYGLIVHFSGAERILWLEKWAYRGDLTSTFVNRNSYGSYAAVGMTCCAALFIHGMAAGRRSRRAYQVAEAVLVRALPYLAAAVILGMAVLLTHSRAAMVAAGAGLLILVIALMRARIMPPRFGLLAVSALALAALTAFTLGGQGTVDRLAHSVTDQARLDLYRLAILAVNDAPLTGHGFGGYPATFPIYRDISLPQPENYLQAHNVHLELAQDLGLAALALLYGGIGWIVAVCAAGLTRRRRDHIYPAVAIAVTVLLAGHGLVDFSLQMPAIAATFALLLGLGFTHAFGTSAKAD